MENCAKLFNELTFIIERKRVGEVLHMAHNELEHRVAERTAELVWSNLS